jgi:hypothetical protein
MWKAERDKADMVTVETLKVGAETFTVTSLAYENDFADSAANGCLTREEIAENERYQRATGDPAEDGLKAEGFEQVGDGVYTRELSKEELARRGREPVAGDSGIPGVPPVGEEAVQEAPPHELSKAEISDQNLAEWKRETARMFETMLPEHKENGRAWFIRAYSKVPDVKRKAA